MPTEGWALYAEQLADELGAYAEDRVGRLGYLQSLAFRACRLVVDTGIHAKRWTREQGVKFFVDVNGSRAALGAKYDVKAFNDTLVLGGNVPLDVLARNVEEHIRTARP